MDAEERCKKLLRDKTALITRLEEQNTELWWALEALVAGRSGATRDAVELLARRRGSTCAADLEAAAS